MKAAIVFIAMFLALSAYSMVQDKVKQDSIITIQAEDIIGTQETLNDIRFGGWTDSDWLNNEYIRTLRKYLDDYNSGKVNNARLNSCKEAVKGKFIVGAIEPSYYGGVRIQITFLDAPRRIFTCWVYSHVDEENRTVDGYELRYIYCEDEEIDNTKEDILRAVEKYPELKLW